LIGQVFPSKDHLTFIKQSITPPTYGIQQKKHPKDEWQNELTNLAINLSIERFELPSKRTWTIIYIATIDLWVLDIYDFLKDL
jgi:hypothetical protein